MYIYIFIYIYIYVYIRIYIYIHTGISTYEAVLARVIKTAVPAPPPLPPVPTTRTRTRTRKDESSTPVVNPLDAIQNFYASSIGAHVMATR